MTPINNTFEVDTHPGVTIVNPEIEIVQTIDKAQDKVFIPCVIIHAPNINIYHILPPQPYVNGTWEDDDVNNSIIAYFNSLGSAEFVTRSAFNRKSKRKPLLKRLWKWITLR